MGKQLKLKESHIQSAIDEAIRRFANEEIDLGAYDTASEREERARYAKGKAATFLSNPTVQAKMRRIRDLRHELDDAEMNGDVEKAAKAKEELDWLTSTIDFCMDNLRENKRYQRTEDIDGIHFEFVKHDINGNPIWRTDNGDFGKCVYWRKHKDGYWYGQSYSLHSDVQLYKDECTKNQPLMESLKSQKLKDFAKAHGGLKQGKWSADFKNDLYNMSDEDFEGYKIVSPDEHYAKYGLNGWDMTGYSNNNFQPLMFGDGTFMVKGNPELKWDDRAKGMMDKQITRRNSRQNDGKNEYQFENPYLNDRFNQDDPMSKPRGSWGYGTDWKLEPGNINMTALRSMEGYNKYPGEVKPGDVAAKAKSASPRNISKNELREMVKSKIRKMLKEGAYGYPDTVDGIILCSENDRELYNEYTQIAKAVAKVYKRDAEITFERLVDSSILKKYQQHCFSKYSKENPDKDRVKSPRLFREYVAKKIIDEVLNGQWDERNEVNEIIKTTPEQNKAFFDKYKVLDIEIKGFPLAGVIMPTYDYDRDITLYDAQIRREEDAGIEHIVGYYTTRQRAIDGINYWVNIQHGTSKPCKSQPMNEGFGKRKDKMPNGDEGYWLTDIDVFGFGFGNFIKADIGYVNDTRKTVTPNHGYYYPNKRSLALMKYAMKLGYRYTDPEMPAKINKTLSCKKMNEYYTDEPNDGYDYETQEPYYPGVSGYYSIKPGGVPDEVDLAHNMRNRETGWTKRELDNRDKMMNKYIKGERDEDDIDDAWYGIHMNESRQFDGSYGYQNVSDEFVEKHGENGWDVLVPEHCLVYLVNGDTEGYTDEEMKQMKEFENRFVGKLMGNLRVGDCCVPMDGEEPGFYSHNDVYGNIGCDCYRFFLPAK